MSTNFLTKKYVDRAELLYIEQRNKEITEILIEFVGDPDRPQQATFLVLWVTSTAVVGMSVTRQNIETDFRCPAHVHSLFQCPRNKGQSINYHSEFPFVLVFSSSY